VTISGVSEAPENVYATVRPAGGAPCGPSYSADTGSSVVDGYNVNGAFTTTATVTEASAGNYMLCLWLAASESDSAPIAGPQPIPFTVAAPQLPPPPPADCVVPTVPRGTRLAAIERRVVRSHCTIGRISYAYSRSVRRGTVVRLSPGPRTHLANDAGVTIIMSLGKRRN
jgi:hypothetical protein